MDVLQIAESIIDKNLSNGIDDAFFVLDLEEVKRKYEYWIQKIPRVVPYYAVKSNDDERVMKLLRDVGAGYDCASKKEISQILNLNVDPNRIIYSNTIKQVSHIMYAAEKGVDKITFDSAPELEKIKQHYPNAKVVLRIFNLGFKFGCDHEKEAPKLIKLCKDLDMNLIGLSFHIGSFTNDHTVYVRAFETTRKLFDYAETLGMKLNFIDIGGGFGGKDLSVFDNYAASINAGIEKYFPSNDVEIISEPGRFFVDTAFSVATQVILKKPSEDGQIYYYVNESIYMSFLTMFLYKVNLKFSVIRKSKKEHEPKNLLSSIWGCTCNSMDKIIGDRMMPEVEMGDWLVFFNMGDYTTATSTKFNGFNSLNVFISDDIENL
ncbi:ornithine decarboxylase 1-like [Chironomus tepperi]|uniref:ornithine decarboxylase 1-like n=1 Tax=Chironomus tepperi TaxID=113505 RepID=UPI00391F479C